MTTDKDSNKPVFNTPNPSELKAAAKDDPIQEREDSQEADVVETEEAPESGHDSDTTTEKVTKASITR